MLRARLGEEIYSSWFASMEFEDFDGRVVRATVPVKFLKNWIQNHYSDDLLQCCAEEFTGVERVDVALRQPGFANARAGGMPAGALQSRGKSGPPPEPVTAETRRVALQPARAIMGRTNVNGFEGSPLDPRYTFDSFVVGPANRMAHAAATQVADTVFAEERGFNPLYLHASVGLGKTHLQHAIAWEVRRRTPKANVLYLTAERFRYQFVEAIKSQDAMAFKDKFRSIDILLIDDLEFMRGEKTEQEFEHIINSLLDGGRQVVVASARPPVQLDGLNDRMRSRLQRGLDQRDRADGRGPAAQGPAEAGAGETGNRPLLRAVGGRVGAARRQADREWARARGCHQPPLPHLADDARARHARHRRDHIRDLVQGIEPRRIKIEDILRIVSRHFAVSKQDILSQRRHRSVVRPRQIGMYLAKHLTSRSLPEIGRRFGDRDHTTVLHAIRKIDKEVGENPRLKDEIEELKRQLSR